MLLRFAIVGGGLLLLALIPALAEVVSSASSRRGILHCLAAEELLAAGWLVPAEREFKRALKLQPLLGAAHCGLAKIRLRQERLDEAVAEYRAAVAALRKVDRSLGRNDGQPLPSTLTAALVEALEESGRHGEADQVRRSEKNQLIPA
jgi:tetratricopeptide (TPR) repeat protein